MTEISNLFGGDIKLSFLFKKKKKSPESSVFNEILINSFRNICRIGTSDFLLISQEKYEWLGGKTIIVMSVF